MFVGFNVRVECESLVKICEEGEFATISQMDNDNSLILHIYIIIRKY